MARTIAIRPPKNNPDSATVSYRFDRINLPVNLLFRPWQPEAEIGRKQAGSAGKDFVAAIGYHWQAATSHGSKGTVHGTVMTHSEGPAGLSFAERSAVAVLLEQHRQRLLDMLRGRLTGRLAARKDAEDLAAEVYLVAQRKWRAFQAQNEISAWVWLYGIARDCLSEAWARETRGKRDVRAEREFPDRSSEQLALGLMASMVSPSSAASRKESKERVQVALARLKPADREILVMRHYDQLSFKDAAQVLGITQNAANVRYVRALDRLKAFLEELGFTSG